MTLARAHMSVSLRLPAGGGGWGAGIGQGVGRVLAGCWSGVGTGFKRGLAGGQAEGERKVGKGWAQGWPEQGPGRGDAGVGKRSEPTCRSPCGYQLRGLAGGKAGGWAGKGMVLAGGCQGGLGEGGQEVEVGGRWVGGSRRALRSSDPRCIPLQRRQQGYEKFISVRGRT